MIYFSSKNKFKVFLKEKNKFKVKTYNKIYILSILNK